MEKKVFKVYYQEIETNVIVRGPIEVDEESYPELKGKTEKEIIEYLEKNAWDMKSKSDYYENLGDELSDYDVVKDKIIPESSEIIVEVSSQSESRSSEDSDEEEFDDEDDE